MNNFISSSKHYFHPYYHFTGEETEPQLRLNYSLTLRPLVKDRVKIPPRGLGSRVQTLRPHSLLLLMFNYTLEYVYIENKEKNIKRKRR